MTSGLLARRAARLLAPSAILLAAYFAAFGGLGGGLQGAAVLALAAAAFAGVFRGEGPLIPSGVARASALLGLAGLAAATQAPAAVQSDALAAALLFAAGGGFCLLAEAISPASAEGA